MPIRHSYHAPCPMMWLLIGVVLCPTLGRGDTPVLPGVDSPRRTRDVEIIAAAGPAVVAIFSDAGAGRIVSGSGSVVHGSGLILTNHHVVEDRPGVVLIDQAPPVRYRLVGSLPEYDLAILEVPPPPSPLVSLPLGRSDELFAGEPILVGGNPGGRGIIFSKGILSSPGITRDMSALIMRQLPGDRRLRFLQFDAASNGGNSGGPLLNALGQEIGVVCAKVLAEENSNYAIPIDRVLSAARELLLPEERRDVWTGLTLDPWDRTVRSVAPDSPAAKCEIEPGDRLEAAGGHPLAHILDWYALLHRLPPETSVSLRLRRGTDVREVVLEPVPYPTPAGITGETHPPGLVAHWASYAGQSLPDWATLTSQGHAVVPRPALTDIPGLPQDQYALRFEGFVELPRDGVYWFALSSDDGSRLWVRDHLLADNDGLHPAQTISGRMRLGAGRHPLRLEFFEGSGDAEVNLTIGHDGTSKPLDVKYFHEPVNEAR